MTEDDLARREAGWRRQTRLVRGGTRRSHHGETSEPIYLNSGFCYDSAETAQGRFAGDVPGFVYSRYGNPTVAMLERRLALMEGAEACFATASGMSAVFAALMCQVQAGDKVVAARALFSSCAYIITDILPRFGVDSVLVDGADLEQWRAAIDSRTAVVFFESPANPTLELTDIAGVADLAKRHGASVVVDNVFATPLLQRPLQLGADVVMYSATKHIDGQGRCLGGAVLCSQEFYDRKLLPFVRHTGPAISPFNAWVMLKGLETLELRIDRHVATATRIAGMLSEEPAVSRVLYPGLPSHPQYELAQRQMGGGSTLVTFEMAGDGEAARQAAFRLQNRLRIIDISNNLGDSKSLICHPPTTTHRSLPEDKRLRMGITPGMLRLSVGLEDADDLIDDLHQALHGNAA